MTVAELKAALIGQGLVVHGNKGVLVARLEQSQAAAAGLAHVFVCAVACIAALTVVLSLFIMS